MRISVCSIAWRADRRSYRGPNLALPFAELLPRITAWGYRGIELWDRHVEGLDGDGLAELRARLDAHGLAVPMLSGYFDFTGDEQAAEASLAHGRAVLARARALGAAAIRIFTGKRRSADAGEEAWARCTACLRALCDDAGPIALAAEIHDWNLTDTVAGCERLIAGVARPNLGLIFHPTHFLPDPLPAWRRLRPHVRHVHATNLGRPLDDGAVDWRGMLAHLRRDGYDGWISVEWFGDDPDAAAAREAAFLADDALHAARRP